jgi:hypothetical protein
MRTSSLLAQLHNQGDHSFREKMIKGDFNSFCQPALCTSGHSVLSNVPGSCDGCRLLRNSHFFSPLQIQSIWGGVRGGAIVSPLFRGSIQRSAIKNHPSLHSFFENETPLFPPHMPLISNQAPIPPGYGGNLFVSIRFFYRKRTIPRLCDITLQTLLPATCSFLPARFPIKNRKSAI